MKNKVTIIGFGTMGKAIAGALWRNDRTIEIFGVNRSNINSTLTLKKIKASDFIILAIKPQNAQEAIGQIKTYFNKKTILISIMAGISIKKLIRLSGHKKIVRMMPNLGLSVGEGIAVWKKAGLAGEEIKKTKSFINKITENFEVKNEEAINKITVISGSGPAYFFLLADSLMKACASFKISKKESRQLVEKTFSAAALLGKDNDYSALIKKVASKKGVTEVALKVFQKENFNKMVQKAVQAAYQRAKELNNE